MADRFPCRWTNADTADHDDGIINVSAVYYQRRDGRWCWSADVAAYTLFVKPDGLTGEELGKPLSSGTRLADTEPAARAACETWIEAARLDRLGLKFMTEGVTGA